MSRRHGQVSIRPARPPSEGSADLGTVAAIFGHYVEHTVATFTETPPTVAEWADRHAELISAGLPFLVADTGEAVVGFAYAAPWRSKAAYRYTVEDTVYLDPAATGRGLGTSLLSQLLTQAAASGYRQMIAVIADTGDPASVNLHRRLGFANAGRLTAVGFKHDRWVDTLLMQREVGP